MKNFNFKLIWRKLRTCITKKLNLLKFIKEKHIIMLKNHSNIYCQLILII